MSSRVHPMPFGAATLPAGGVRFRLWAPACEVVDVEVGGSRRHMHALADGWHEAIAADAAAGTHYRFVVPSKTGALAVPDPASRSNPDGVHGASVVVEPEAFTWSDVDWRGRPWREAVVYELHIGTFTPKGTFKAAAARLAELAQLGITAVELMPVAAFAGQRNWGYDGVLHFAPAACYGTPHDLKAFIDEAHSLGIMVLLDVVYNHFGPDGNYLHAYCPQFFNAAHRTPWGAAINFDGALNRSRQSPGRLKIDLAPAGGGSGQWPEPGAHRIVRDFFIHNALYWIEEYHVDGLRMDAVHAIRDDSTPDIVCDIAQAIHDGPGRERQVHLVLENDANIAHYLERRDGAPRYATAQWNDDLHHTLHVVTTGEQDGYYADYLAPLSDLSHAQDTAPRLQHLGRALAQGFAYQGEHSPFRAALRGEPSYKLPPMAFIGFLQNHDQVGNRAFGERLPSIANAKLLHAAYACLLLSPQIPMLFMGEEFAASTPFLYFCDFEGELAQAVANGRRDEFKRFAAFADTAQRARIPDPNAAATFAASTLKWEEREQAPHREQLERVRELLGLRRRHLMPGLDEGLQGGIYHVEGELLHVEWTLRDGVWHLLVNFSAHDIYVTTLPPGECIHAAATHDAAPAGTRFESGGVMAILGPPHV